MVILRTTHLPCSSVQYRIGTEKNTLLRVFPIQIFTKNHQTRGKQDLGFVSQLNSKDFRPVFFPRWTYDRKRDGHESYPAFSVLPSLQFRSFSFGASNLVKSPAFWNEMRIGGNPGQCRRLGRLHRHPRRWSRRQPKALFEGNLSISSGSFHFSSSSLLIK